MNSGFFQRAQDFKPILIRILARHRGGDPLSTEEIALRSGLEKHTVEFISWQTSWDGVDLPSMEKFLSACDANFESVRGMSSVYEYLRSKPMFTYLHNHPLWKTYYLPMMATWRKSYPKVLLPDQPSWKPIRGILNSLTPMLGCPIKKG